jgi:hypothetical protein
LHNVPSTKLTIPHQTTQHTTPPIIYRNSLTHHTHLQQHHSTNTHHHTTIYLIINIRPVRPTIHIRQVNQTNPPGLSDPS